MVFTRDRASRPVKVLAAVMEGQRKMILSDRSIDALGIELLKPGAGNWRFRGEEKQRRSEKTKVLVNLV